MHQKDNGLWRHFNYDVLLCQISRNAARQKWTRQKNLALSITWHFCLWYNKKVSHQSTVSPCMDYDSQCKAKSKNFHFQNVTFSLSAFSHVTLYGKACKTLPFVFIRATLLGHIMVWRCPSVCPSQNRCQWRWVVLVMYAIVSLSGLATTIYFLDLLLPGKVRNRIHKIGMEM